MVAYWYSGAVRKPLARNYTDRVRPKTDGVCLHVAAGESLSLHGWFSNAAAKASSHFYVLKSGVVEQYIPVNKISWAGVKADQRLISIETQGMGEGTWTQAQLDAIDRLIRWLRTLYEFPYRQMTSSKASERGIGYHLLGVPASQVQKAKGISQTGGELWSGAVGKVCPGPGRVKQIPGIVSRLNGGAAPAATVKPAASVGAISPHLDKKIVQQELKDAGYYAGVIDGIDGPLTKNAVHAYQAGQKYYPGLKVDSFWGDLTQRHFEWVKSIQSALNGWKTASRMGKTKVDGDYGAYTAKLAGQTMTDNFAGAYTTAVKAIYGAGSKPVNDGIPGAAFCKMLGIPTHPTA